MPEAGYWAYRGYQVALVVTVVIAATIAVMGFRRRAERRAAALASLMASCGLWSLLYALEMPLPGSPAKLLISRLEYFGIVAAPLAWLVTALEFAGKSWITRRRLAYLSIMPLVTLCMVWTNDLHHWFWTTTGLALSGPFWLLATTYGPAFCFHTAYSYALMLAGSYFLLLAYRRTWQLYRRQARALLLGMLAPWCGNVIFLTGLNPLGKLDLTPLAFLGTGLALGWSVFGQHLLDLAPIARDVVFTNLSDQVFVIELSDLKSRFVSTTSHEFRTPLSAILSSAELLERHGARWEEDRRLRHLHQIEAAARHMAQLLEDVLTIGRAEAGQLVCHPTALDLGSFCRDLVDEMGRITLPGQTIALSERDLPVPAWLDEKLLREILTNLLSNAIKYSPAGQPIALTAVRCGPDVVLSVTDQGIGIPLADQARLYEAFHRAANVGTIPGTGLGLAVLKKAVDTHGGRIECESAPGQGTIFTVTLRAAQPAGQPEPCDA